MRIPYVARACAPYRCPCAAAAGCRAAAPDVAIARGRPNAIGYDRLVAAVAARRR